MHNRNLTHHGSQPNLESVLPASIAPSENHHFRLLDLPSELRTIIYEFILIDTVEHVFENNSAEGHSYKFRIITSHTSINIIATCRQVRTEASSTMAHRLEELSCRPPRLLVGIESLPFLACDFGPLWFVNIYLRLMADDGGDDLKDAIVIALNRAEGWMDNKSPRLIACMKKWFLLFKRQRSIPGRHGSSDSVPTVEIGIRNENSAVGYEPVYNPSSFVRRFPALQLFMRFADTFTRREHTHHHFRYRSRLVLADFSRSLAESLAHSVQRLRLCGDMECLFKAPVGDPIEDAEFREDWSV